MHLEVGVLFLKRSPMSIRRLIPITVRDPMKRNEGGNKLIKVFST